MKIYIAGKITGFRDYESKFKKAEKYLKSKGHQVINPSILPGGFEHEDYMHICYAMIDVCHAIFFLDNWKRSKGALLEHEYAKKLGKGLMFQ